MASPTPRSERMKDRDALAVVIQMNHGIAIDSADAIIAFGWRPPAATCRSATFRCYRNTVKRAEKKRQGEQ